MNHIPNVLKNKEYIKEFYEWGESEGDIGKFYDSQGREGFTRQQNFNVLNLL